MPALDPDIALLGVLSDPVFPDAWCVFDGQFHSLGAWVEEAGDQPEAPAALAHMLAAGLDPLVAVTADGTPLLHHLVDKQRVDLAGTLLDRISPRQRTTVVNALDTQGKPPLWYACNGGNDARMVNLLLKAGADTAFQHEGRSVLWVLCDWRETDARVAMARHLLDHGVAIDAPAQAMLGQQTPLHNAVAHDNAGITRLLLEAGARTDVGNVQGVTVHERLVATDEPAMVQVFQEHRIRCERVALRAEADAVTGGSVPARRGRRL